jgi:hypothetical protein
MTWLLNICRFCFVFLVTGTALECYAFKPDTHVLVAQWSAPQSSAQVGNLG